MILRETDEPFRKNLDKWLFSPGTVAFYFRNAGFLKTEWVAFFARIMHEIKRMDSDYFVED